MNGRHSKLVQMTNIYIHFLHEINILKFKYLCWEKNWNPNPKYPNTLFMTMVFKFPNLWNNTWVDNHLIKKKLFIYVCEFMSQDISPAPRRILCLIFLNILIIFNIYYYFTFLDNNFVCFSCIIKVYWMNQPNLLWILPQLAH